MIKDKLKFDQTDIVVTNLNWRKTFSLCWLNVGPPSAMRCRYILNQNKVNSCLHMFVVLMLVQCRMRWPNFKKNYLVKIKIEPTGNGFLYSTKRNDTKLTKLTKRNETDETKLVSCNRRNETDETKLTKLVSCRPNRRNWRNWTPLIDETAWRDWAHETTTDRISKPWPDVDSVTSVVDISHVSTSRCNGNFLYTLMLF